MRRLFVEADGALMDRADINRPEDILHPDYYKLRIPEWNMILALSAVIASRPELEVHVICPHPLSIERVKADLSVWYANYLPGAKSLHFLPLAEYFGSYIALQRGDVLISANVSTLAVFSFSDNSAIGVDVDPAAVPKIPILRTWDHPQITAGIILAVIDGRNGYG